MKNINWNFIFLPVCLLIGCDSGQKTRKDLDLASPVLIHEAQEALTDVIVYDIFSPPVASRIYAYANLAAYEALLPAYPEYISFNHRLNEFDKITTRGSKNPVNFHLASIHAFFEVGKAMIFSEDKLMNYRQHLYDSLAAGISGSVMKNSLKYGEEIATTILDYAEQDNYLETRGFKYTIMDQPGKWKPTPPAYMDAIEPFWNKIRPFLLDSASQFKPAPPPPFSLEKDSEFHQELMEVYHTGINITEEERSIASFWDCNPYVMHTVGHVMYATKKITPGGHWMGIAKLANQKMKNNFMKSVEVYTKVAITLADAFISCWDEKYRSNLIRPETLIDMHIDDSWDPVLQTPPFPEYTSGHSVISKAASVMLTELFGENFEFADSTEMKYGLPVRNFSSFEEAAEEAAISRLYGGIHYRCAIENGLKEGLEVGNFMVEKINGDKVDQLANR